MAEKKPQKLSKEIGKVFPKVRSWFTKSKNRGSGECPNHDPNELPFESPMNDHRFQPESRVGERFKDFSSFINNLDDMYLIYVDVYPYAHGELTVKLVAGNIVLEGKHKEEDHNSMMYRQSKKLFPLPKDCNTAAVECKRYVDDKIAIIIDKYSKKNDKSTNTVLTTMVDKNLCSSENNEAGPDGESNNVCNQIAIRCVPYIRPAIEEGEFGSTLELSELSIPTIPTSNYFTDEDGFVYDINFFKQ